MKLAADLSSTSVHNLIVQKAKDRSNATPTPTPPSVGHYTPLCHPRIFMSPFSTPPPYHIHMYMHAHTTHPKPSIQCLHTSNHTFINTPCPAPYLGPSPADQGKGILLLGRDYEIHTSNERQGRDGDTLFKMALIKIHDAKTFVQVVEL